MEFFAKRWLKAVRSLLSPPRHRQPLSSRRRPATRLCFEELEQRLTPSGNISTIAGNGSSGYSGDGGPATSAKLYNAYGTAVDSSGNVFIADTNNNRIREVVASTGTIITVAGNGSSGYSGDNGPATSAMLSNPYGVAVDSSGNLFIADAFNNRIREVVASTGNIITIAGNGTGGFSGDGGSATSAAINFPEGVAVDSSGNVFIADESNMRVREVVKSTGVITTIAGNGTWGYNGDGELATAAELYYPKSVAVDSSGNVYIADWYNNRIREVVKSTGAIATVAGTGTSGFSGDGGAATSAMLNLPVGVAVDTSGNVYIGDTSNSRIREVTRATGVITTIAGNGTAGFSGDGGPAVSAALNHPYEVALDSSNNIYVADAYNLRIREVQAHPLPTLGSLSSTGWTVNQPNYTGLISISSGTAPFSNLTATGLPAGLTASLSGSTITISGTPTATGTYNSVNISIQDSYGLTASHTYTITINALPALGSLSPTQAYVSAWGYSGAIPIIGGTGPFLVTAQANLPPGLTATSTGTTITFTGIPTTTGTYNNIQLTVRDMTGVTASGIFTITPVAPPAGSIITYAGNGNVGFGGDSGNPLTAQMNFPRSVAVDSSGNLYIADQNNQRIREVVKATGNIITVAGNGSAGYSGDNGPATSAMLNYPSGVAVDSSGNLYIADVYNNRIREVVKATGNIITIAGNGTSGYAGDGGAATSAEVYYPFAVAVDSSGNVYIADTDNYRIREVTKSTGVITTIAGNGTAGYSGDGGAATSARLFNPYGVGVDASGNVYIADTYNERIREVVKSTGIISTFAGNGIAGFTGDGGAATSAELYTPESVYVDASGNVYIADAGNNRIREVTHATGNITTLAGNGTAGGGGDAGAATSASLNFAYGVAVDSTSNVFIADANNNRVREIPNPNPILNNLSSTAWTVNQASYSGTIAITGGTAPYSNLTVTGLPAGLTASLSGSTITIAGTPTASGTFNNVNVSLTDSASHTGSHTYTLTINAAPTLGALSNPAWTVNRAYGGTIAIIGGTSPFSNLTATGLPAGFSASVSGSTITLSGTPTATGSYSISVHVTDVTGAVANGTFALTINPAPALGSLTFSQWTVGQSGYNGTIPVTGGTGTLSLSAGNMVPGLYGILSGTTISFGGTPTTAGTYNVQMTVQDSTGASGSVTYTITINAAPTLGALSTTAWTVNHAYSGTIGVTAGTSPFNNLTVTGLPTGLSAAVSGNTITVSGTPTATGTSSAISVSVKDASGYTVSSTYSMTINAVPTLGTLSNTAWTVNQAGYGGTIAVAAGTTPYSTLTATGLPAGLSASLSGSTITVSGTPTATGTFSNVAISVKDASGYVASSTYSLTINPAPTLGTMSQSQWTVNRTGYSGTIAVTGGTGAYSSFTYSGLPTGLTASLSGSTITLSGTPTATGTFGSVTISLKDATGANASHTYSMTINALPTLNTLSSTAWTVNQPGYTGIIGIIGGTTPFSILSVSGLPAGLSAAVNGPSIMVTGTPTVTGTFSNINVSVRDVTGASTSRTFSLTINPAPALGGITRSTWTVTRPGFPATIAVTGGTGTLVLASQANLPPGLTAVLSGTTITFTGTPTTRGVYSSVSLAVRDSTGATATQTYTIVINPLPTLSTMSFAWTVNAPGLYAVDTIMGGSTQFTNLNVTGLPAGVYAYIAGNLIGFGGTPTAVGTFNNINISVQDASGAVATGTASITINPAPTLGTLSNTAWTVGQSGFSATLGFTGGTQWFSNLTVTGLPAGLSAAQTGANTITISGTPTATGTFNNINVSITDAAHATASGTFTITINAAPTLGALSTTAWTVNQAGFNSTLAIAGGTSAFSNLTVSGLPAGLTAALSGSTITFSGTPTATGTFNSINVSVTDAAGATASGTFAITINAAPTLGSTSVAQWTVNQAGYSDTIGITGGTSAFSNLTVSGLPAGLTAALSGSTITLSGTPTATGTYGSITVSVTDAAGAVASGTYSLTINAAPALGSTSVAQWTVNQSGYSDTITVSGGTGAYANLTAAGLPAGVTATLSGSTISLSGTPTATGVFNSITIGVTDATGATASGTYSLTINAAPALGSLSTTAWTVNQAGYGDTIGIVGGTSAFGNLTVSGLPAGLSASLSGTTITVSGTPTAAGTFNNINIGVTDAAGATATGTFTITINAAPTLGTLSNTAWTVNQAGYSGTIGITGGTTAYSNLTTSGLPAGLTAALSGSTITLSGTPTATGTYGSITVSVTDAAGAVASGTYSITINAAPALGSTSVAQWTVNQSGYSDTITVSGGTGAYANLTAAGLPAGVTATLSGSTISLSGTPTATGVFNSITISVTDATGATASGTYSLTINAAPTLGSLSWTQWTVNQAGYSGTIGITGGTTAYSNLTTSGLPAGLSAVLSGNTITISGTPTAAGTFNNITVSVTDAAGAVASGTYSLTINPGLINTAAGNGTPGYSGDGGSATSAQLNGPSRVAVDSSGDLFIADTANNVIREVVQATGNMITVAGNGTAGYSGDSGPATSAQLNAPSGLAVDASGDLFIADTGNNVIREVVQATGTIITVAGTGTTGYSGDGGAATAAQLNGPHGVAVDASGDLFIADTGNNAIREVVQATGIIVTVAGTGTAGYSGDGGAAASAQLNGPYDVAIGPSGNLFIADTGNNVIREVVQATGTIITVAGTGSAGYSGDGAAATSAQLNGPVSIAVDANGNLFIADAGNNAIREVLQATGTIITVAGTGTAGYSGDGGLATAAQLNSPDGLAVDASGDLFIADTGNNCIRKVQ